jgi:hypothetical protein
MVAVSHVTKVTDAALRPDVLQLRVLKLDLSKNDQLPNDVKTTFDEKLKSKKFRDLDVKITY